MIEFDGAAGKFMTPPSYNSRVNYPRRLPLKCWLACVSKNNKQSPRDLATLFSVARNLPASVTNGGSEVISGIIREVDLSTLRTSLRIHGANVPSSVEIYVTKEGNVSSFKIVKRL